MAALLALLTAVALAAAPAPAAEGGLCLSCHRAHYESEGPCVSCHKGDARTKRVDVAHHGLIPGRLASFRLSGSAKVAAGRRLTDDLACRRCHVLEGKGNALAGALDWFFSTSTPAEAEEALRKPALFMPDFRLSSSQGDVVVTYLLFAGSRAGPPPADVPAAVHFGEGKGQRENVFVKSCGGCHRALTAGRGGLGTGSAGPNLSGLFTPFYPPSFGNKEPWTPKNLKAWLDNPRRSRPMTTMSPVPLETKAFTELLEVLGAPAAGSAPTALRRR